MRKSGDENARLLREHVAKIAESNRLLGMMQAIEEIAIFASQDGVTVDAIMGHCIRKSCQVTEEHAREFKGDSKMGEYG